MKKPPLLVDLIKPNYGVSFLKWEGPPYIQAKETTIEETRGWLSISNRPICIIFKLFEPIEVQTCPASQNVRLNLNFVKDI